MGLLGPSKSELADRIDELEDAVDGLQSRVETAEKRLDEAGDCVNQLQKSLSGVVDQYDTIEDKLGAVETLSEPKIAWKATENHIVKLLIPEGATVVHPARKPLSPNKKRTDEAIVVQFYDVGDIYEGAIEPTRTTKDYSQHEPEFIYEVGQTVIPYRPLNKDTLVECTSGIHFFCSKEAAIDWL